MKPDRAIVRVLGDSISRRGPRRWRKRSKRRNASLKFYTKYKTHQKTAQWCSTPRNVEMMHGRSIVHADYVCGRLVVMWCVHQESRKSVLQLRCCSIELSLHSFFSGVCSSTYVIFAAIIKWRGGGSHKEMRRCPILYKYQRASAISESSRNRYWRCVNTINRLCGDLNQKHTFENK